MYELRQWVHWPIGSDRNSSADEWGTGVKALRLVETRQQIIAWSGEKSFELVLCK